LFENELKMPQSQEAYNHMRVKIKALSIREQRCFSGEEVLRFFEQGLLNGHEDDEAGVPGDQAAAAPREGSVDERSPDRRSHSGVEDPAPGSHDAHHEDHARNGVLAHI
jgi:hypothetical protein